MKLEVKNRDAIGSNKVKHLRREGWIPAVIYGHGEESKPIKIKEEDLLDLIHSLRSEATLIDLNVEGEKMRVLIREVVRDPLTEDLIHADFQHIHEDEEVNVHVLVEYTGDPEGVEEGGVLNIERRHITARCLPEDIPEEIEVDISELGIGQSIHISDLDLPEGVKVEEDPATTLVNILSPRKVIEVKPAEEEVLMGEELEEPEVVSEEEEGEEIAEGVEEETEEEEPEA